MRNTVNNINNDPADPDDDAIANKDPVATLDSRFNQTLKSVQGYFFLLIPIFFFFHL